MDSKYTILIAEDDSAYQDLYKEILSNEYQLTIVNNGKLALDELQKLKNNINLVILDINMPELDGYEVLNRMNTKTIPVLIVSTLAESNDKIKGLDFGAWGFTTKPFKSEVLKSQIKNLIKLGLNIKLENKRKLFAENKVSQLKTMLEDYQVQLDKIQDKIINHKLQKLEIGDEALFVDVIESQKSIINMLDTQFKELKVVLNFYVPEGINLGMDEQFDSILKLLNELFDLSESLYLYKINE